MSDKLKKNEEVEKVKESITMACGKWLGLFNSEAFAKCINAGFNSAILTRKLGKLRVRLDNMFKEHVEEVKSIQKDFFKLDDNGEFLTEEKDVQFLDPKTGTITSKKMKDLVPKEDVDLELYNKLIRELENEEIEIKFPPFSYEMLDASNFRNEKIFFTEIDHQVLQDLVIDDLEDL